MSFSWRWTQRLAAPALGLWLAVSAGLLPAAALAEGPRPTKVTQSADAKGKVRIDAMVVHATNSGRVDPRLQGLQRKLTMMGYNGATVLSSTTETVAQGQSARVSVVGGRQMRISFLDREGDQARVRIQLFRNDEKVLDTTVRLPSDKAFVVAGPKYDGGILVFPITVSY